MKKRSIVIITFLICIAFVCLFFILDSTRKKVAFSAWLLLTIFTVSKCWLRKDNKESRPLFLYSLNTSIIAFITCSAGSYYLYKTLPSEASPEINNLTFYYKHPDSFDYFCYFEIRNDGDEPCILENIDFYIEDKNSEAVKFEIAKSATVEGGFVQGGGGDSIYGTVYGGGGGGISRLKVNTTFLPQKLLSLNIPICIVGKTDNKNIDTDSYILVKIFCSSKGKMLEPMVVKIPMFQRQVDIRQ